MTLPRPWNFSAGPATLPVPVLERAAAEMLDWHGSGLGVMEMSHRGKEFGEIIAAAQQQLRSLLAVPPNFHILFMQGGGLAENAIVPLNLSRGGRVDVVVTGSWSAKSAREASRYADVAIAATGQETGYRDIPSPSGWQLRRDAAYVHICSNETIDGVEFATLPDLASLGSEAPLVVDCSSHILSRHIDWQRVGLAFAGAQKNVGPAGLTLVFVREDLMGHALPTCPSAFDYATVAANQSMYNTPPTYAIYIAGLVFDWVASSGGVAEMDRLADEKSRMVYNAIDQSGGFYTNRVSPSARSRMNIPFQLADPALNDTFLAESRAAGLLQLKGHKSVGGMRASIYNAMPVEGVQALVGFMKDFSGRHG